MAETDPTPTMRSPSQWPAVCFVSISAGRWSIIVMFRIRDPCPVRLRQRVFRSRRPVRSFNA
jgi:hypothetical protein